MRLILWFGWIEFGREFRITVSICGYRNYVPAALSEESVCSAKIHRILWTVGISYFSVLFFWSNFILWSGKFYDFFECVGVMAVLTFFITRFLNFLPREQLWYKPNSGVYIKLLVMLGKCKQPEKPMSPFNPWLLKAVMWTINHVLLLCPHMVGAVTLMKHFFSPWADEEHSLTVIWMSVHTLFSSNHACRFLPSIRCKLCFLA